MKKDLYRAFMRSMKTTVSLMKNRPVICRLHTTLCAACGQNKPCLPVNQVGFICLDCNNKKN